MQQAAQAGADHCALYSISWTTFHIPNLYKLPEVSSICQGLFVSDSASGLNVNMSELSGNSISLPSSSAKSDEEKLILYGEWKEILWRWIKFPPDSWGPIRLLCRVSCWDGSSKLQAKNAVKNTPENPSEFRKSNRIGPLRSTVLHYISYSNAVVKFAEELTDVDDESDEEEEQLESRALHTDLKRRNQERYRIYRAPSLPRRIYYLGSV